MALGGLLLAFFSLVECREYQYCRHVIDDARSLKLRAEYQAEGDARWRLSSLHRRRRGEEAALFADGSPGGLGGHTAMGARRLYICPGARGRDFRCVARSATFLGRGRGGGYEECRPARREILRHAAGQAIAGADTDFDCFPRRRGVDVDSQATPTSQRAVGGKPVRQRASGVM